MARPTATAPAEAPGPQAPESSRYRLLRRIGSGGMAEVFLAVARTPPAPPRLAVVKRIWPDLADDPDFIAMFVDEAAVCARMDHPNVVRTYEIGREHAQYFIAMEYLEGRSLKQLGARLAPQGGLPLSSHLRILTEVLAGLEHAHGLTDERGVPLGIVHRDVSPQNVFVTYDGAVKLVDFGIAKSVAASHRTRPGILKGRLSYMAPEQMRGRPVDRRADLFSVGVMLWEAAAGRRLWMDLPEAAIVARLSAGPAIPPPLGTARLPSGLVRVCRRALALDPADRYATAADFRAELEALLSEPADRQARELGQWVSTAFADERAAMAAVARRGLEDVSSAFPGLSEGEGPAPRTGLTESALRPFETDRPLRASSERGAVGVARLGALVLLAGVLGVGAVKLVSPASSSPVAREAARTPPAPPSFGPIPVEPVEPAKVPEAAVPPGATNLGAADAGPLPSSRADARRGNRKRRASAPEQPEGAPPAPAAAPAPQIDEPFEATLVGPVRRKPRPIDAENPYLP